MTEQPIVEVVICTYNRASGLRRTLEMLAAQTADRDGSWAVTVVDNNCTDATATVVDEFVTIGSLPNLRRVPEPRQGLVEARQRGFHATTGPWIAFVDDDCEVAPDWVASAIAFIALEPRAAGFNGRNTLAFDGAAPRYVHPGMFAGFDVPTENPIEVSSLHGAGLVLRRNAVVRSGWLDRPALPDRRGRSLISGGDNELAVRAKAGAEGGALWFVPSCRLVHRVDPSRTRLGYLVRLNYGLAQAHPQMYAIKETGDEQVWRRRMMRAVVSHVGRAVGVSRPFSTDPLAVPGSGVGGRVLSVARCLGFMMGFVRLLKAPSSRRSEILGLATTERVEAIAGRLE